MVYLGKLHGPGKLVLVKYKRPRRQKLANGDATRNARRSNRFSRARCCAPFSQPARLPEHCEIAALAWCA